MKSHLLGSLVLTVAFATCTFAAKPFQPFVLNLAPGSSPETVRKALGAPAAMLGKDLWVYYEFSKPNPNVANPEFDALAIAFTDGRVTAVKITDGRVVRQLIAQHKAQSAAARVARK
jgi:hypothetical protein